MASTLAFADSVARRAVAAPSRRVGAGAVLLAVACVLGLVEASLPGIPFAPWLRLGLANIAVVIALVCFGIRVAAVVGLGRVVVVGLATGSLAGPSFVLAAAGALASLGAMWAVSSFVRDTSPVGWSAAGSAAHVAAQFAAAAVVLGTASVFVVAVPSVLFALLLGALIGYLATIAVSRLQSGQMRS